MFIIHGIGEHEDFREGEFHIEEGKRGEEGGNHEFRSMFSKVLATVLHEVPVALEM